MKSHPEAHPLRRGARQASWLAFVLLAGCATPPAKPPPSSPGPDFGRLEEDVLHALAATDTRVARRAHLEPTEDEAQRVAMEAMLREDPTVAVVGSNVDPFSFDARARGLALASERARALPAGPGRERELVTRLVEGEQRRLDEERRLPLSGSALVRAIVDTWEAPRDEREAADRDRWLTRRLGELRVKLVKAPLDTVRARDLDDALDALERVLRGLTGATQELVRVRDALESTPAPAPTASTWSLVAPRLAAHLGLVENDEALARMLAVTEKDLRDRATTALAGRSPSGTLFTTGPCLDVVAGSRLRSMAAPPEREPSCQLRHAIRAEPDAANALALLHDHVAIAAWALAVARGGSTLTHAQGEYHLLIPVADPALRSRYERIALARPVAALAAGLTARLLAPAPSARATAWATLGDVPLDIAAAELRNRAAPTGEP